MWVGAAGSLVQTDVHPSVQAVVQTTAPPLSGLFSGGLCSDFGVIVGTGGRSWVVVDADDSVCGGTSAGVSAGVDAGLGSGVGVFSTVELVDGAGAY